MHPRSVTGLVVTVTTVLPDRAAPRAALLRQFAAELPDAALFVAPRTATRSTSRSRSTSGHTA